MLFKSLCLIFILCFSTAQASDTKVVVGSKRFTESYILAEIMALLLEDNDIEVERRFGLGGTLIAYDALRTGAIDLYPEYTGTLSEAIFKVKNQTHEQLKAELNIVGLDILEPFGFNNTYALIMNQELAEKWSIKSISDLSEKPELFGALGAEFQKRSDGWNQLRIAYNLKNKIRTIEIPLSYEALKNKKVDFSEAYSTEPLIKKYNFIVLKDDKSFFPKYQALPLVRKTLHDDLKTILLKLSGLMNDKTMMDLNERAANGESFEQIARSFLADKKLLTKNQPIPSATGFDFSKLLQRTQTHLILTCLAVLLAALIAVPLATVIAGKPKLAHPVLTIAGLLQTIPSIALLTFMIPLVGIGFKPALLGLFIYSLLPIIRNTYVAMNSIDPRIIMAARGIGLYPREILFSVKLPLSFPMILAGIRTATILNIGTATLAAFIGAGGLGEPIVMGLALNDTKIILEGAIPAAILAILMDFFFGFLEKVFNKNI